MCSPNPNHCGGSGGCQGATAEIAFDYLTNSAGLFEEFQYPYTSYYGKNADCLAPTGTSPHASINGYVKLAENNYTALMNAIATVGPIAISVDANWGGYESGVFNGCTGPTMDIDHAVVLVGYGVENGQKYWLVRNSWSPAWGEQGYIKLARSDDDESKCAQDVTPQDGSACDGQTEAITVCGTCGVLYDSSYPLNAAAL
jgi:cathepsin L